VEFGPIWRASLRNKTGALLVVLQVAFTLALIVNSVAIAERQARAMSQPIGVEERDSFVLRSAAIVAEFNGRATSEEDLRQLRGLPGVVAAVQMNSIPGSGSGMGMGLKTSPEEGIEEVGTSVYMVDEHGLGALGVDLIAGENFSPADVSLREGNDSRWPNRTILSKTLAEALFPGDAGMGLGKTVYIEGTQAMTVIGIVERLQAPWAFWQFAAHSILVPWKQGVDEAIYFVRAEPGRRDALMPEAEALLADREPGRIIQNMATMEEVREAATDGNRALVNILAFTVIVLVAITTLGVAGLTSFNVTRRYKQIGTRRALGASRGAILRYFLAENLLFTLIGVVLGAVFAIVINIGLQNLFAVPRFSWIWTPVSMALLVAISLVAVLIPAMRAAQVPPAVATRTV
jgi:putative ABC transport system permease protein